MSKDIDFKNFKSGVRRHLKGDNCPNAKLQFNIEWFQPIANLYSLNLKDDSTFKIFKIDIFR